jgi:ribosomal protein S18 acetylase RimI-like enzyme
MEIRPLTPERWPDFVDLFTRPGPRGGKSGPIHCSCMWWRDRGRGKTGHADNKRNMAKLVREGGEPGLLAYDDGKPTGWISVAPREQHGRLLRSREYRPEEPDEPGVWSIVCFYIHPAARHEGLAKALLDAAVEHAARRSARVLEAYPHNKGDYMGTPQLFDQAGFKDVRPTSSRTVMRRNLSTGAYR